MAHVYIGMVLRVLRRLSAGGLTAGHVHCGRCQAGFGKAKYETAVSWWFLARAPIQLLTLEAIWMHLSTACRHWLSLLSKNARKTPLQRFAV